MLQTLSDWLLYSDTFQKKKKKLHHLNSSKHLIWRWEANSETFRPYQLIGLLTSSKTLRSCMQYWLSFQHFYFWTIIFSFLNHYFQHFYFEQLFSVFWTIIFSISIFEPSFFYLALWVCASSGRPNYFNS